MTDCVNLARWVTTTSRCRAFLCLVAFAGLLQGCDNGGTEPAPFVYSITVTPAAASVAAGATQAYAANGKYSDGSSADVSAKVSWTSSDPAVATVTAAGVASAVTAGTSTISAALGAISGSAPLTVTAAVVDSITVTPGDVSVESGLTQSYTATALYSDQTTRNLSTSVTWASSNPGVASISNSTGSNGVATAVTAGTTNVTATLNGVSGRTQLTVTQASLAFAYVANTGDSSISLYQLHISSGILSPNGSMKTASEPRALSSDDTGAFLYVLTAGDGNLRGYTVNNTTGALTAFGSATAVGSGAIALRVAGTCAFVLTQSSVLSFARDYTTGVLTPTTPASVATGNSPSDLQYINDNVLVTNFVDDTLAVYSVAAGCALTASMLTPAATGNGPSALAVYDGGNNNARVVVVNTTDDTLSLYAHYNPPVAMGATANVGRSPSAIAMFRDSFVYVTSQLDNAVSSFATANSTIALTPIGAPVATGSSPTAIAVNEFLPFAYVTNGADGTVSMYRINTTTGALTAIGSPVSTGRVPLAIAIAAPLSLFD